MLHTQTLFLDTKSLKITFAAPVESFGGLTGALLCLECGDLAVYHSWWMRLLLLSGEEGHWEPALSCQGFSLRKWTESIKNSEVASPEAEQHSIPEAKRAAATAACSAAATLPREGSRGCCQGPAPETPEHRLH